MKMKKLLFISYLLLTVHLSLMAQQSEIQIRQKISQVASSIKTMQCDFIQTKHLKMLNDDMVSKGRMYYQQGNRLRWEYTSPYIYIFIINNDKVLLKNNQRNDVIDVNKSKLFKEIARMMMNSVVGSCLTDEKSFKSSISVSAGEWVATLLPHRKDMKQMFQKIVLHFSQKQAMVTQVELIEKNGDATIIDLKHIRTNETISTDMFTIR
jgi:outer membrane lipoprotein carrier protein